MRSGGRASFSRRREGAKKRAGKSSAGVGTATESLARGRGGRRLRPAGLVGRKALFAGGRDAAAAVVARRRKKARENERE